MINPKMMIEINEDDTKGEIFTTKRGLYLSFRGSFLHVPKGFESDGASVPRMFWRVVFPPLDRKSLKPAIAHDYIYAVCPEGWTRAKADLMFYMYLLWNGTPWISATLAYLGVRIGGGKHWGGKSE